MSLSSPLTALWNSAYKICFYLDCCLLFLFCSFSCFCGCFSSSFLCCCFSSFLCCSCCCCCFLFYFFLFVFFKDFKMLKMGFLFGVLLFPFLSPPPPPPPPPPTCPHFKQGIYLGALLKQIFEDNMRAKGLYFLSQMNASVTVVTH